MKNVITMNPSSLPVNAAVVGVVDPTQHHPFVSNPGSPTPATLGAKPSRLWLWFVAAFLIQAVAWTALFRIASQNRVEEVPLATKTIGR
jgi:hypothetical protein